MTRQEIGQQIFGDEFDSIKFKPFWKTKTQISRERR